MRKFAVLAAFVGALCSGLAFADVPPTVTTLAADLDGAVGGVTVDAVGFIYVADFGEKVWKVSPYGEVELFADSLYGASGNAIDLQGNLLQSNFNGDTITRITRDGETSVFATGLEGPVGLAVGKDGTVYACNCRSNTISRISEDGSLEAFATGDLFNCPNGITIDGDGNLYVVNFSDGRMIRISTEGDAELFATIPGGGNGHVVWVGPELYVTGFRANRIYRVDADGSVTPFAGSGRFGEQDGAGLEATFSTPNGIAYDRTRDILYTNDHLIPWSKRFERRTRPVSALRAVAFPTLKEIAAATFETAGAEAMIDAVVEYRKQRPGRVNELILNLYGYELLSANEIDNAIAVFEANAKLFPKSFNVWDSLAEAHRAAGHREKAIELYRKSLELNPANTNATRVLKEMEAE